jgi:hypothetical protein
VHCKAQPSDFLALLQDVSAINLPIVGTSILFPREQQQDLYDFFGIRQESILISILRPLLYLLLAASLSIPSLAQSFVFASPNTREHMSDEAALASQGSFEQQNFLAVARFLAARLCQAPKVQSSLGLDGAGSENSALVTGCRPGEGTYLGVLLGRYAHQKWVLVFTPAPDGTERLFVLTLHSSGPKEALTPEEVLVKMRKFGLSEGTVIAQTKESVVYLWVKDASQDQAIHALAEANHSVIQETRGTGLLIGSDDRAQAQGIFDRRIFSYERTHHLAYSAQLWSKKLRDMGLSGATPTSKIPSSPAKTTPTGHGAPNGRPSAP